MNKGGIIIDVFLDAEQHIYTTADGVVIPSVSEIIAPLATPIPDFFIEAQETAAFRGSAIHAATEQIDAFGECEIEAAFRPYILGYLSFLEQYTPKWAHIEGLFASEFYHFAGTVDRAGYLGDKFVLLDIKTAGVINKPLVSAQLNGYRILLESKSISVDELYCLQLLPKGGFRLYPVDMDCSVFLACKRIYDAKKAQFKRGTIMET